MPFSFRRTLCALLLAAVAVSGCQRDYRFETRAHYTAPIGGFDVQIHASGVIKAGNDLSDASWADVTIAAPATRVPPLQLRLTLPRKPSDISVARAARQAGFTVPDDEAAELEHAVGGALRGPKATLMEGQTHALKVVDVTFVR